MTSPSHVVVDPSVLYVGTPAFLIATENPDGSPNLAPASSYWALGKTLVLGIELDGQTASNLLVRPDLTVNFPSGPLWQAVVRLSGLTGRDPVPEAKRARYRFEPDKFGAAGLTPQPSDLVEPPRVHECALQFEARVARATPGLDGGYLIVEAQVLRVHAWPAILDPTGVHIDPNAWNPLVYAFRHFYERGTEVGWLASSPTAPHPPVVD
ncbi:flavin reductase family protein [Agromyces sp. CFH 90414]|uniref:Flavin reductase family protein n=1 Tax=Agromyces agglutinans TaxID=2662258 RepID=A0A6I2F7N7_9MICO|nr:flavin reductase family protein [Agromyces agglutinans]MRG60619.1 flavin reductase family protein [Agromyces agglutinans]